MKKGLELGQTVWFVSNKYLSVRKAFVGSILTAISKNSLGQVVQTQWDTYVLRVPNDNTVGYMDEEVSGVFIFTNMEDAIKSVQEEIDRRIGLLQREIEELRGKYDNISVGR